MSWHYGIPNLSVVFLLLLSFPTQSELNQDCNFEHVPIQSGGRDSFGVEDLKSYLLLDYPVPVPSNLKLDAFCLELWNIHLIHRNLKSMLRISGDNLKRWMQGIMNHTKFVEDCNLTDSCVTFKMTNISHFLEPIPSLLVTLHAKMKSLTEDERADFSNCTIIQCQPDVFTTPVSEKQGRTQPSESTSHGKHYLGLLIIPVLLLPILICLRRRRSQRLPRFEEPDL
ncbi:hypothetical protein JRQ81_005745 [Phrynocephalus forsythii]|uniref:Uncharacterized protein n=1 Tax=Phrynocephalus forsythii TaxID=171643 RepID=A0A9Q0XJX2_9SAUR|nr:hypothetical protein JRQ81_005745 [Phrynocephalus forsythii]